MKWETAFRVVAHELRSPAGVISGYARLLKSGRLDADGQTSALAQIDRASSRLEDLGQAASDLSRWLEPRVGLPAQMFEIRELLDNAVQMTPANDRIHVVHGPHAGDRRLRTDEPRAFAAALSAFMSATVREVEMPKGPVQVGVYDADSTGWCDVVMIPRACTHTVPFAIEAAPAFSLLESGGLGLHVVLGTAVVEAHGGRFWTSADVPGLHGIRLPIESHAHD